jgi:transposase
VANSRQIDFGENERRIAAKIGLKRSNPAMSMRPRLVPEIPEETVRVAQAAFPKGNLYMQLRDEWEGIYTDEQFADLYPADGQPTIAPWRLALVTVMQFMEDLSDRQAAEAVRDRIAWKYALSLALSDAGFDYSVLSEFRQRLVAHKAGQRLLDGLLSQLKVRGLLQGQRQQRTDSTHILTAVRELNRLENVGETMRHTLNRLAREAPDWLRGHMPPEWLDRYGKRFENWRLPKSKAEQQALAEQIGADGYQLLALLDAPTTASWLGNLPAVEVLRQMWQQQYSQVEGQVKQRPVKQMPPESEWIRSPYDTEARYCTKRTSGWVGYRTHLTETCDEEHPRLITQVKTTIATEQDCEVTRSIQADLVARDLKPDVHLVDAGYVDAANLAHAQQDFGINLWGPTRPDTSWQAKDPNAFDILQFNIDWDHKMVTCPAGQHSAVWAEGHSQDGAAVIRVNFPMNACMACPLQVRCTRGVNRGLTLRPQLEHQALQAARQRETTDAFWQQYRQRAGIEATISQAVRGTGLRRSRYIGLAKTHLQAIGVAVALDIVRAINWLNDVPLAATRSSPLAALVA